jgi:hypothetical protein
MMHPTGSVDPRDPRYAGTPVTTDPRYVEAPQPVQTMQTAARSATRRRHFRSIDPAAKETSGCRVGSSGPE